MSTLKITKKDMEKIARDPGRVQTLMINALDDTDEVSIDDPSNPLVLMLEMINLNNSVAISEFDKKYNTIYPMLSTSEKDLYKHLSYKDYSKIFSQPASTIFQIYINVIDLMNKGISVGDYKKVSIPEMTNVLVNDSIYFTFLNRIDIKLYNSGKVSIEQNVSSTDIGVQDLGILPYKIISQSDEDNNNSNTWVMFETSLKQLGVYTFSKSISESDSNIFNVTYEDSIYYIEASIEKNNIENTIEVIYQHTIFDSSIPTILVEIYIGIIKVEIPEIYMMNGSIIGNLNLKLFTTKGEVTYPLSKQSSDKFIITYNNLNVDQYTSVIPDIAINCLSPYTLSGGSTGMTVEALKESIINNTYKETTLPITEKQLETDKMQNGFYTYKVLDTITDKQFVASKTLADEDIHTNGARLDIFIILVSIINNNISIDHPYINVDNDSSDKLIIKSNTLFKEENSIVSPLTKDEVVSLESLSKLSTIEYLNANKILFSPYYYISSIKNDIYYNRILDLDNPTIHNLVISKVNTNVNSRINTRGYTVDVTATGYTITLTMANNSEFNELSLDNVICQLKLPIYDSSEYLLFKATLDYSGDYKFVFNLETDFYVNEDNAILITNGQSPLSSTYISLDDNYEFITYLKGTIPNDTGNFFLSTEEYIDDANTVLVTALTLEYLTVEIGIEITHLWKNISSSYTERKYKKYTVDVPALYTETIYDLTTINTLLTAVDTDEDEILDDVEYTILHEEGDPILDGNNDPTYIHRIGDTMLDENSTPIIDVESGVIKYLDMLLLEYNFKLSDNNYVNNIMDILSSWMETVKQMNENMLENSNLVFKPFKSNSNILYSYNNNYKSSDHILKPKVTLYTDELIILNDDKLRDLKISIGKVLHTYLDKSSFSITEVKRSLENMLEFSTSGINIQLDVDNEFIGSIDKLVLKSNSDRFVLNKQLENTYSGYVTVYELDIEIIKI